MVFIFALNGTSSQNRVQQPVLLTAPISIIPGLNTDSARLTNPGDRRNTTVSRGHSRVWYGTVLISDSGMGETVVQASTLGHMNPELAVEDDGT